MEAGQDGSGPGGRLPARLGSLVAAAGYPPITLPPTFPLRGEAGQQEAEGQRAEASHSWLSQCGTCSSARVRSLLRVTARGGEGGTLCGQLPSSLPYPLPWLLEGWLLAQEDHACLGMSSLLPTAFPNPIRLQGSAQIAPPN